MLDDGDAVHDSPLIQEPLAWAESSPSVRRVPAGGLSSWIHACCRSAGRLRTARHRSHGFSELLGTLTRPVEPFYGR